MYGCGAGKNSSTTESVVLPVEKQLRITGTVVKQNGDCALYISIPQGATELMIVSINLDERFQLNGMRLRFDYTTIKTNEVSNCSYQRALLEEVSPLR